MALFTKNKLSCENVYSMAMSLLKKSSSEVVNKMRTKGTVEREALKSEIMGEIVCQSEGYISDEDQEEVADLCLAEFNADKFMIGYLFKPHHPTVNYLRKGATGDLRRKFSHNFTANKDEAEVIFDGEKAKKTIVELVERFPKDDEYQWTPVIINIKENTLKVIIKG